MKVVINKCFGGFSLSHKAVMLYGELKGIKLYAFVNGRKTDGGLDFNKFVPYIEDGKEPLLMHYSTSPLTDGKYDNKSYFSDRDIERTDPLLIKVVEELGKEASGRYANLKIVEIPDGTDYEIDEYDGNEHIAEQHRTWG